MANIQYWLIGLLLTPVIAYCDLQMFKSYWKDRGLNLVRWQDYLPITVFEFAMFAAGYLAGGFVGGVFQ